MQKVRLHGAELIKQVEYEKSLSEKDKLLEAKKKRQAKEREKQRKERQRIKLKEKKALERKERNSAENISKRRRIRWLKERYNITLEQYESMYNEQHGTCAICKQSSDRLLIVDHDHTTGHVRGLLCHSCNVGLGLLGDTLDSLMVAVEYLRKDTA